MVPSASSASRSPIVPIRNEIYDGVDVQLTTQNEPGLKACLKLSLNIRYNNRLASGVEARQVLSTLVPTFDTLFTQPADTVIEVGLNCPIT